MRVFAVWSDLAWEELDWPDDGLPGGPPYNGKYAATEDVPDAVVPEHLIDGSISVPNPGRGALSLWTGVLDVYLHTDRGIWKEMKAPFVEDQRDLVYSVLLTQSRVRDDGSFGKSRYLNAVEHDGTRADEKFSGRFKIDLVDAGAGDDILRGRLGADRLNGQRGDDKVIGGDGQDILTGGRGHDKLFGGKGSDVAYGNAGADLLKGGAGFNDMYGNSGRDKIISQSGVDYMYGGRGRDRLVGDGADYLFGGPGRDVLVGKNDGTSRLVKDEMTGGAGADRFVFVLSDRSRSEYAIMDFQDGVDTLDMRRTEFQAVDHISHNPTHTVVTFGGRLGLELTIYGEAEITGDDFLF